MEYSGQSWIFPDGTVQKRKNLLLKAGIRQRKGYSPSVYTDVSSTRKPHLHCRAGFLAYLSSHIPHLLTAKLQWHFFRICSWITVTGSPEIFTPFPFKIHPMKGILHLAMLYS